MWNMFPIRFADVLHWEMGVEFQVAALQAVIADQLGGDTIHHKNSFHLGFY